MTVTSVYIGSDHAGFEAKTQLIEVLRAESYQVSDCGAFTYDPEDDYPAYCIETARCVVDDPGSLGIVLGGSGNGEQIAANKVRGVRAALGWSRQTAQLAREHNDANVLGIGARMHSPDEVAAIALAFLSTEFSGAQRHVRRIGQLAEYEAKGELA